MSSIQASQESDDEMEDCPICVEPFDESDRLFLPCHCNYRVCMFCVRRLMTEFDGRCPGCRSVYNEANFRQRELSSEEIERRKLKEKQRAQAAKQKANAPQQSQTTQAQQQAANNKTNMRANPAGPASAQAGGPAAKKPVAAAPMSQPSHLSPLGGPSNADELAQQRKVSFRRV
jgi:hypothetical protein